MWFVLDFPKQPVWWCGSSASLVHSHLQCWHILSCAWVGGPIACPLWVSLAHHGEFSLLWGLGFFFPQSCHCSFRKESGILFFTLSESPYKPVIPTQIEIPDCLSCGNYCTTGWTMSMGNSQEIMVLIVYRGLSVFVLFFCQVLNWKK